MFRHSSVFKRLCRDDRGNVAMMFGLGLIPMVLTAGTALDYSRLSTAQSKLHSSLDSAVLAIAKDPTISSDPSTPQGQVTQGKIQAFFNANLTESHFNTTPVVTLKPSTSEKILVEAQGCLQLAFAGFTKMVNPCIKASSEVTRPGQVFLEVALSMDTSGSMAGSKMDGAKDAARQFATSIFQSSTTPEQIKISVVPFSLTVNTGLSRTATGVDSTGLSPIHWENLLAPTQALEAGVTSRFSLFDRLEEPWGGCMETRPGALGLNDSAPSNGTPASLYVPYFAPDEPGDKGTYYVYKNRLNEISGGDYYFTSNSYLNDDGGSHNTHNGMTGMENNSSSPACPVLSSAFSLPNASPTANWQDKNWLFRNASNMCKYNLTGTSGGSASRKSTTTSTYFTGFNVGPNYMCNSVPALRLNTNKDTVIAKINQLEAKGATNILDGFMWAWRTLSPNAPYQDGRGYRWTNGLITNKKILVLMTDGDNTWNDMANPNGSIYSPNGYYRNNRLASGITTMAQANAVMNSKTLEACTNAKATRNSREEEAIQIYTVGFSTPGAEISTDGLQLLQNCASTEGGRKLFYRASNVTELAQVFSTIAANIGKLKLSQ